MSTPKGRATADDLRAAYGDDGRAEVIHGEIVEKALPKYHHGRAGLGALAALHRRFHRPVGGR